jgi:predicted phage terminase large subunit-like protein
MQAWCKVGHDVLLLDQWRAQADIGEASRALIKGTANCQAAAVLIEWSGYGQALAENLRRRFSSIRLRLVPPDGRPKVARVLRHIELIQSGRIKLPQDADWRDDYESEFEQFPHPPDDQVDATTQFLDFIPQYAALRRPRKRSFGLTLSTRFVPTYANEAARLIRPGYANLGRRGRMRYIFPRQHRS